MSRTDPASRVRPSVVPPLQPGDRLTRAEFERRYDATPGLKKAELIEGIVYMPPPVSHVDHSVPHARLVTWLGIYGIATPGVVVGDNGSLRLDLDNMPQPDAYVMVEPKCGGHARVDQDGYVVGAPELVGEVSASSVSIDLHAKLNVYRRNGVQEYIVWRTQDRTIDYFVLREGVYEPQRPDSEGIYKSEVLSGLWLASEAMTRADVVQVEQVLRRGVASPEHAAFIERLRGK